jgi:hypothetical protein
MSKSRPELTRHLINSLSGVIEAFKRARDACANITVEEFIRWMSREKEMRDQAVAKRFQEVRQKRKILSGRKKPAVKTAAQKAPKKQAVKRGLKTSTKDSKTSSASAGTKQYPRFTNAHKGVIASRATLWSASSSIKGSTLQSVHKQGVSAVAAARRKTDAMSTNALIGRGASAVSAQKTFKQHQSEKNVSQETVSAGSMRGG